MQNDNRAMTLRILDFGSIFDFSSSVNMQKVFTRSNHLLAGIHARWQAQVNQGACVGTNYKIWLRERVLALASFSQAIFLVVLT